MATFAELAVKIRELIPLIESGTFVEGAVLRRLNETVRGGANMVAHREEASADDVSDYCRALEELSACLRRCESRLLERKLYVADQLRHLRNVNQWARSSVETI